MTSQPTRRDVLRWGLVGGFLVAVPVSLGGCGDDDPVSISIATPTPVPSFLSPQELAILRAMIGRLIPTDSTPGALDAGADVYIDRLLSIVPDDSSAAEVFAGGPYSGRQPEIASNGTPSAQYPPDEFKNFIPLTRLQLLSWRVRILGTDAVPDSSFNGSVKGWRQEYREGLASIQAASRARFSMPFEDLAALQQEEIMKADDSGFVALVTDHTIEGTFCDPVYGGNRDRIGWRLIGFDGDSQPLGYSQFDATTQMYRERRDKPNSTADPDDPMTGVDEATQQLLQFVVRSARPSFVSG